jgi:5-oxoprolinase (ATP-hydrolysing)
MVDKGTLPRDRTGRAADRPSLPGRNPGQNIADLKAQIAANEKGVQELSQDGRPVRLDVVEAYMGHVQDNAEESVRRVIERCARLRIRVPDRHRPGDPREDHGRPRQREATVDFTGTSDAAEQLQRARTGDPRRVLYVLPLMVEKPSR